MLNRILQVQSNDPEDTRRRNLLNILLAGIFVSSIIGFLIIIITILIKLFTFSQQFFLIAVLLAFFIGDIVIFLINRRRGQLAIFLFLIFLLVGYMFSDTTANISNGSSVFFFAIPIIMASLLIHPLASFIIAAIGSVIITWANSLAVPGTSPNFIIMIGFFMLALISWLASRSLEEALRNLRQINANLDHLVQERTQELADALSRERIEAGRSKAILESIADGVIVFDVGGRATIVNPSTARLLEIPTEDIVGASIENLSQSKALASESRATMAGLLTGSSEQLASYHIEWGKKSFSVTSAPVNDTQGTHIGTVAVFRDYTHEAEVERMKNTFLAIVSHELRTPLNAILGYSEMVKEAIYGPVNEKQARASERIMTNSRRLLDIVSDLLDQAQMEAGKLSLHVRPFRPSDLVDNLHGVMDKIAGDKGLIFSCEIDPTLPEFMDGDIARLQQILVNLSNNAIKFTEQGSVHLRLLRSGPETWSLEVKDTGIGIPENELPSIFEAFRQVDSTVTRKYGGFGLGLTIVKQLSELMGGNIIATSQLGAGSCFLVTLPIVVSKMEEK